MRLALILVAAVLVIGLCAQQGFQAMCPTQPTLPAAVIDGPYRRASSKLWVSQREDRERSQRRSHKNLVSQINDSNSETRRGMPRVGNDRIQTYRPSKPYSN